LTKQNVINFYFAYISKYILMKTYEHYFDENKTF